jgi:DNA-binding NarL/FixJ family response regulator
MEPGSTSRAPCGTAVLVADTRPLVREGIKAFVASTAGTVDFFEAEDGNTLLRAARRMPPTATKLAFISLKMPGLQGGALLGELALRHPQLRIVVFESFASADMTRRAMNVSTVYACIPSDADEADVQSAICAALERRKVMPTVRFAATDSIATLTPRQNQIYELLRRGMTNKMIASALHITEGTAKNHVANILKALNATNRTQAAQFNSNPDFQ